MTLLYLVVAYAICFGVRNKLPFLYSEEYTTTGEPETFIDRLLHCTYCTGFHCGWATWLLAWWVEGELPATGAALPASILVWSLASSAFCYAVDAAVCWFEGNTG